MHFQFLLLSHISVMDLKTLLNSNADNMRSIIVKEMYRPVRVNFPTRRIEVKGYSDLLQLDLADLTKLSKFNKGYKFFLLGINVFSRKIFTFPLKTKTSKEVSEATLKLIKNAKTSFKHIFTDGGLEFFSKTFKNLVLKPLKINHYTTKSGKKAAHAERYIKTVKTLLYRVMDLYGTNNWIDILKPITDYVNNQKHSRLGFIPGKIKKKDEKQLLKIYQTPRPISTNIRFKINDQVRISNPPKLFRRAFNPYWSAELYKIHAINKKHPVVYELKDFRGNILPRKYYQQELQKTAAKDCFLVEKVIKRKGKKVFVKYLGYDSSFNEWVDEENFFEEEKR